MQIKRGSQYDTTQALWGASPAFNVGMDLNFILVSTLRHIIVNPPLISYIHYFYLYTGLAVLAPENYLLECNSQFQMHRRMLIFWSMWF